MLSFRHFSSLHNVMGRAIPAGAIVSPNVDRHTATTTMDQSHSVAQAVILMDGMSRCTVVDVVMEWVGSNLPLLPRLLLSLWVLAPLSSPTSDPAGPADAERYLKNAVDNVTRIQSPLKHILCAPYN